MKRILLCLVVLVLAVALASPAFASIGGGTKVLAHLETGVAQTAETLSEGTPVVGRDMEALISKDSVFGASFVIAIQAGSAAQSPPIAIMLPQHTSFGLAQKAVTGALAITLLADNRFSPAAAPEVLTSTGIAAGLVAKDNKLDTGLALA